MKNIFLILLALLIVSCGESKPKVYKYVTSITNETHTYPVTITKNSGGNSISRGAGGALIGGTLDMLSGGDGTNGAVAGGLIGMATTDQPSSETYTEIRTDITYIIKFSDSTIRVTKNRCRFKVGDSVEVDY
jgi:hypothetical protein